MFRQCLNFWVNNKKFPKCVEKKVRIFSNCSGKCSSDAGRRGSPSPGLPCWTTVQTTWLRSSLTATPWGPIPYAPAFSKGFLKTKNLRCNKRFKKLYNHFFQKCFIASLYSPRLYLLCRSLLSSIRLTPWQEQSVE